MSSQLMNCTKLLSIYTIFQAINSNFPPHNSKFLRNLYFPAIAPATKNQCANKTQETIIFGDLLPPNPVSGRPDSIAEGFPVIRPVPRRITRHPSLNLSLGSDDAESSKPEAEIPTPPSSRRRARTEVNPSPALPGLLIGEGKKKKNEEDRRWKGKAPVRVVSPVKFGPAHIKPPILPGGGEHSIFRGQYPLARNPSNQFMFRQHLRRMLTSSEPAIFLTKEMDRMAFVKIYVLFSREWEWYTASFTNYTPLRKIGDGFVVFFLGLQRLGYMIPWKIALTNVKEDALTAKLSRLGFQPSIQRDGNSSATILQTWFLADSGDVELKEMLMDSAKAAALSMLHDLWHQIAIYTCLAQHQARDLVLTPNPDEIFLHSAQRELFFSRHLHATYVVRAENVVSHLRVRITTGCGQNGNDIFLCLQPTWGETAVMWDNSKWDLQSSKAIGKQLHHKSPNFPLASAILVVYIWNCRGAETPHFDTNAFALIASALPSVIIFTETLTDCPTARSKLSGFGYETDIAVHGTSSGGGMLVAWDRSRVKVSVINQTSFQLHIMIVDRYPNGVTSPIVVD